MCSFISRTFNFNEFSEINEINLIRYLEFTLLGTTGPNYYKFCIFKDLQWFFTIVAAFFAKA